MKLRFWKEEEYYLNIFLPKRLIDENKNLLIKKQMTDLIITEKSIWIIFSVFLE